MKMDTAASMFPRDEQDCGGIRAGYKGGRSPPLAHDLARKV